MRMAIFHWVLKRDFLRTGSFASRRGRQECSGGVPTKPERECPVFHQAWALSLEALAWQSPCRYSRRKSKPEAQWRSASGPGGREFLPTHPPTQQQHVQTKADGKNLTRLPRLDRIENWCNEVQFVCQPFAPLQNS